MAKNKKTGSRRKLETTSPAKKETGFFEGTWNSISETFGEASDAAGEFYDEHLDAPVKTFGIVGAGVLGAIVAVDTAKAISKKLF